VIDVRLMVHGERFLANGARAKKRKKYKVQSLKLRKIFFFYFNN